MYFPFQIPNSPSLLLLLLGFTTLASAQKVVNDPIDFRELESFNDQRNCVQICFYERISGVDENRVAQGVGCKTNKCLCGEQTFFELALEEAETCTARYCKTLTVEDANAAKKLLQDYCVMKGYTLVGTQTTPDENGDGRATVTVTVTATAGAAGRGGLLRGGNHGVGSKEWGYWFAKTVVAASLPLGVSYLCSM